MSAEQSHSTSVLFTIKRKTNNKTDIIYGDSTENSLNNATESDLTVDDTKILCIIHKSGKIGAAYYSFMEQIMYIYEEIIDVGPQFMVTRTLCRELNSKYVLTFGHSAENYVKQLIDIVNDENTTNTTDGVRNLPQNFFLLSLKEYTYELCKQTLSQVKCASFDHEICSSKREIHLHAMINFDNRLSVHCAGALIRYLEKNWPFFRTNQLEMVLLHIYQISLKNHILLDNATFHALQIFNQRSHDSSFKRGAQSSAREDFSLFKLFVAHCKSKLGQKCLKNLFFNPTNDIAELNKRLDFINFTQQPINKEIVSIIQDNIKQIMDVNIILTKIQNSVANIRDWFILHQSIYHTILINELCEMFRDQTDILMMLSESITNDLIGLEQSISSCLDFTEIKNKKFGRPEVKYGLDENLDAKKLRLRDLAQHLTAAAHVAASGLPDFIDECAIVYYSEMGHLLVVKQWQDDCNAEELNPFGYQFMFALKNEFYYKNPLCIEMDKNLGDITGEIIDHENRILRRLTGFVLKHNRDIREPLKIVALIDCLLSMAIISTLNNYSRPILHENNQHEIVDSRHPLMEILITPYQTNNFHSGGNYPRMKLITGPNGSGKSVYMKQITIIIYLAHVGCYVPAKYAKIGPVYSIHTRMQATESVNVRLSSFMIDLSQITQAMYNCVGTSLVLVDEFGRGTNGNEGLAILCGVLNEFLQRQQNCPHILISTHYQKLTNYIRESDMVKHEKMAHTKNDDGHIVFLYKIEDGVSESFGFDIARGVGLDMDIVQRAKQIYKYIKN